MSAQTDVLRNNLHTQLDRLLDQLTDLDQIRGDMEATEYDEARQDTVDQLEDFSKSLEKMKSGAGGLSLLDEVQRIQIVRSSSTHLQRLGILLAMITRLSKARSVKHFKPRKSFDSSPRNSQCNCATVLRR